MGYTLTIELPSIQQAEKAYEWLEKEFKPFNSQLMKWGDDDYSGIRFDPEKPHLEFTYGVASGPERLYIWQIAILFYKLVGGKFYYDGTRIEPTLLCKDFEFAAVDIELDRLNKLWVDNPPI